MAREGRQVSSLQRRVRSHEQVHAVDVKKSKSKCSKHHMFEPIFGSWGDEEVHAVVARSVAKQTSKSNMYKAHHSRTTFGVDVEKVKAVVARSTSPSQTEPSTTSSDYFWKLRCWKSARLFSTSFKASSYVKKAFSWRYITGTTAFTCLYYLRMVPMHTKLRPRNLPTQRPDFSRWNTPEQCPNPPGKKGILG